MGMASFRDKFSIVPYGCLYIDASWSDILSAIPFSMEPGHHRSLIEYKLDRLWNHAHATPTPILPCLSVRTAFDLYLSAKQYPRGSEMVFCAINIPDMARIVRHHGIKLVALDVDIETLVPKVDHLQSLITPKTVAILVAHLYGRWVDLEDIVAVAKEHRLDILEDCAEAFSGIQNHGHPAADVTFFSFGLIKTCTAFGGAIAVVRDQRLLAQMRTLYHSYPIRGRTVYLKKLIKYSFLMTLINSPFLVKHCTLLLNALGINHRDVIVNSIRGFPQGFFDSIRMRPSVTLLFMMYRRLKNFDVSSFKLGNIKGDIVSRRLPPGIQGVGQKADKQNYWLFPILVDNPERVMKELNARGVDAYRGATQLDLIESDVVIPRNLANPLEKVQHSLDHSSGPAEDTSSVDKAASCGRTSAVGEPRGTSGTTQPGVGHSGGLSEGQLRAGDVNSARTSPVTDRRLVPGTSESNSNNRELSHRARLEQLPGHVDNSMESSTARTKTNQSLESNEDNMQDRSLEYFNDERAEYVSIHSNEATGQSNNHSRGLTWVAQSQSSNTPAIQSEPHMTSPSTTEQYRNSGIPSDLHQQSHFSTAGDTKDLCSVSYSHLPHQHVHRESHAQSPSEGSPLDLFPRSDGTDYLDPPASDLKTSAMQLASNNHSMATHTLNHPSRTQGLSGVNHSSNTAESDATNTQREPRSLPSNTNSPSGGGTKAYLEPSGKSPKRTLGDSPSVMSGKYPQEAST
ncbi:uncharacterized protein LOC115917963 [Strongylocentrotus purpuratus]|uniref:Uncharacterized protein n=1 Tax=Strongylocentrotus purpuratus TaxID=7668 RepID=A0A7M7PH02_STRPU|nr:uncharacterized protein LOC115917963 [Strongylocentrotus purpuratus]